MEFSIKDSFSKCDQIRMKLRIWSHLLKKSLMGNFIFCVVKLVGAYRKIVTFINDKLIMSPLVLTGHSLNPISP